MMKKIVFALTTLLIVASCKEASIGTKKDAKVKNTEDSLSYCLGVSVAGYVKNFEFDVNFTVMEKAMNDVLNNEEEMLVSIEEMNMIMPMLQNKMMMKIGEKNIVTGREFLADNAKKENITVSASGLQYEIIKEGNGPKPVDGEIVVVHYKGSFIDDEVFQSTYEMGEPVEFDLTSVGLISGWVEALKMMPVGSKWKIYIPSELGYGQNPPPRSNIKPNSVLIFELELLDIKKPE